MFVDPDYRGQSIGDAILTHMIGSLNKKSVSVVKLETGTLLESALALYKKHGFKYCDAFANYTENNYCLLYTSPSPRDATLSRMPSSA